MVQGLFFCFTAMKNKGLFHLIGFFIFLIAFISLCYVFFDIFIYIVISFVLASILKPLTERIYNIYLFNIRIPRTVAVLLSFICFALVISSFITLFIPLIRDQVDVLLSLNFETMVTRITKPVVKIESFLIELGVIDNTDIISDQLNLNSVSKYIKEIKYTEVLNKVLAVTGNIFVGFMAVSFISFFLLYEKGLIRKQLLSLVPNQYFEITITAVNKIELLLSNYLIGLLIQMTAIFSLASLGLSIFGVKYALTIGVFAAVANLIPYMGPLLGATFGIIVGVTTGTNLNELQDYLLLVTKIVSVFSVVQLTDNIVLQPLIFSKSVKAHPLEIFIIIFAGATLAGIPGMIAAIPVYTIIRVSVMEVYGGYKQYRIVKI